MIGESRMLLGPRPRLFVDLTHYTHDPAVLETERTAVAKQLMSVKRALAKGERPARAPKR